MNRFFPLLSEKQLWIYFRPKRQLSMSRATKAQKIYETNPIDSFIIKFLLLFSCNSNFSLLYTLSWFQFASLVVKLNKWFGNLYESFDPIWQLLTIYKDDWFHFWTLHKKLYFWFLVRERWFGFLLTSRWCSITKHLQQHVEFEFSLFNPIAESSKLHNKF